MQIVDARCVWDFCLILYFLECGVVSLNIKQDESGFSLQRIERRCGSDIITRSGLQVSSCAMFINLPHCSEFFLRCVNIYILVNLFACDIKSLVFQNYLGKI